MATLDKELASMLDMPLFNDGAKKFIGEWHKRNTLQFKPVPEYTVDLDLPAAERWQHVVADFAEELPRARAYLESMVKQTEEGLNPTNNIFKAVAIKLVFLCQGDIRERARDLCVANPAIDEAEIAAVAELAGFEFEEFCVLQIAYELSAACTSIIAETPTGQPCHARTMDWGTLFLRDLAIQVRFVRSGAPVFVASTWCGYLGVLTGMKSHGFSVSINYRSGKGQVADNFAAGKEGGWPVGFLVRNVLETESSYEGALRRLREAPLMAPTYMIVAGVHPGEGICLSRTRDGIKDTCQQTLKKPITQTNVDCKSEYQHRDARTSAPRRVCSVFFLKEHKDRLTRETAWELLHKPPINNGITLYGTVMIPAEGYYDTRVPDDTVLRELTARLAGAQAADSSVAEQGGYVLELLKECWREHGALGGELKPDALEKIVQSWYLLQSSDVRLVLMRARAQFEKFDADGSGFVQGDELDLLAEFTLTRFAPEGRALSAEVQQQVKERLLQGADSNSDGRLEFQEFADWFQHSVSECWNPSCDAQEEHSTMDGGPQTAPEVLVPRLPSTSIAPAPAEEHEHHSVSEQLQEGMQRFEFKPDDSLLFHQFVSMFVQCAAFQSLDLPDKVAVEVLCASAELAPSNQESRVTRAWVLPVLIGVALLLQMFCCNFF